MSDLYNELVSLTLDTLATTTGQNTNGVYHVAVDIKTLDYFALIAYRCISSERDLFIGQISRIFPIESRKFVETYLRLKVCYYILMEVNSYEKNMAHIGIFTPDMCTALLIAVDSKLQGLALSPDFIHY